MIGLVAGLGKLPYWGLLWWVVVALVGNPLCLGQEEHTMCETEVNWKFQSRGVCTCSVLHPVSCSFLLWLYC